MAKLTKAQAAFQRTLAATIIDVAERSPMRRGPWIFDEGELQALADRARLTLKEQNNG